MKSFFPKDKKLKILLYLFSVLIIQEVIFRALFPFPEIKNFNRSNYIQGELTDVEDNYVRNIKLVLRSYPDTIADFVHHLNYYGFRGGNWKVKKPSKTPRVFFIGDSFTEGNMSNDEQTIPKGFEQSALKNNKQYDVMNLGVSGANWISNSRLLVHATPILKPDCIFLIVAANDLVDKPEYEAKNTLIPQYYNKFRPRIVELISQVINGEMLPFRWGLKEIFFTWNSPGSTIPEDEFLKQNVEEDIAMAIKNRNFNPGLINWPVTMEAFLRKPYEPYRILRHLKSYADKQNAQLIVAFLPFRNQVTNYYNQFEKRYCKLCPESPDLTQEVYQVQRKKLNESCRKLKIRFFDFSGLIKNEEDKGNHLYWNYDVHMRGEGYLKLGEGLYNWFEKNAEKKVK